MLQGGSRSRGGENHRRTDQLTHPERTPNKMKTPTEKQPTEQPETPAARGLVQRLVRESTLGDAHKFINRIASIADDVVDLPFTPQEQANFIRAIIWDARKLTKSRVYQREEMDISLAALAMIA